jgi:hypothetical protein
MIVEEMSLKLNDPLSEFGRMEIRFDLKLSFTNLDASLNEILVCKPRLVKKLLNLKATVLESE